MKTDRLMARFLAVFLASLLLLGSLFTVVGSVNPSSTNVGYITDRKTPTIPNTSTDSPASPATNTLESNSTAKYWLKLDTLQAHSSEKIYMGFAPTSMNLFNSYNVGESADLSANYGQYDDGSSVFPFYSNFSTLKGWLTYLPNGGSYSNFKGLQVQFNGYNSYGPGYVVSNSTFGPGTMFSAKVTSLSDSDNIGYINTKVLVNNNQNLAGAYIRLACSKTYPDQWNASGEANGCGNTYGYFLNKEGVPGIYAVKILSNEKSIQYYNDTNSSPIDKNAPVYPAHVGFYGDYAGISVNWAFVSNIPPNGIMPSVNFSGEVYSASSNSTVQTPSGITYISPVTITNNQNSTTNGTYQQSLALNISEFSQYESVTLQNVEFFYKNGTIIPSWLESNPLSNSGKLTVNVTPEKNSVILVDGKLYTPIHNTFQISNLSLGLHNVVAYNPYYGYNSTEANISASRIHAFLNLTLKEGSGIPGTYYPWSPVGPYKLLLPPPMVPPNGTQQANAGHLGLLAIDPLNPQIMYVGTGSRVNPSYGPFGYGGIYKTINGGKSWFPVDYGLPYELVTSILINPQNPNNILTALQYAGVYETQDGGGYWYKVANFTLLVGMTYENGTIFAGVGNENNSGAVVESSDFGQNWHTLLNTSNIVTTISISGKTIYATGGALWGSYDGGSTWVRSNNFSQNTFGVYSDPSNPMDVYLRLDNGSMFNSSNGGKSFSPDFALYGHTQIVFDPSNPKLIFAIGVYSALFSSNGGKTWENPFKVPGGSPVGDDQGAWFLTLKNVTRIYVLGDQGIYYTDNFGNTWIPDNSNLFNFLVYNFGINNNGSQIIASMQDYGGPQTQDGGEAWSFGNLSGPAGIPEGSIVYTNPYNSSWVYVYEPGATTVIESCDGGLIFNTSLKLNSITYRGNPPIYNSIFAANPHNKSKVYFGSLKGVYVGLDYGSKWNLLAGSPTNISSLFVSPNGTIFVSNLSGLYYFSGGKWYLSSGVRDLVGSLVFDPQNPRQVLLSVPTGQLDSSIYESKDGGISFSLISKNPFNFAFRPAREQGYGANPTQLIYMNISGAPLVATTPEGVYISQDNGTTWKPISYNLLSGMITFGEYVNNTLYVSTFGEGIMKLKIDSLSSLPGTINGVAPIGSVVTINGSQINLYDGHFRLFLKPGTYLINDTLSNGTIYTWNVSVNPLSVYNISVGEVSSKSYPVIFYESGLPSGIAWYVNVSNGQSLSSTTSTISFTETNGTYTYTVATSNKIYEPSPSSGSVTVNGGSQSIPATFSLVKYTVTFTESGLPSGTSWSVTFNGSTLSSTTNTISFTASNGTYSYSIGSASGYTASPSSANITVNGKNASQSITFSASSKISGTELNVMIGAVVAIAVIGSAIAVTRKKK